MTLEHRTFLVTGANSGIGRALVEALAACGARLVLAGRSEERTLPVLHTLRGRHPGLEVSFLHLDVSELSSIRSAASAFLATNHPLDVLVNNAGIAGTEALTSDGFDLTYATNHIGPFLLTNLLLPRLRESDEARIVNVASVAHMRVKEIDWSVLDRRTVATRNGFVAYSVTKLMNILHAKALAHRLAGTTLTTSSLHPGGVASNVWRSLPQPVQWFIKLFLDSNEKGAETPLYCATAPELRNVSGRYYDHCREARPSPLAERESLAHELWERTERLLTA
jgi:retinol dehydrogenase-12